MVLQEVLELKLEKKYQTVKFIWLINAKEYILTDDKLSVKYLLIKA